MKVVLTVAGSDPVGGAGVQGDVRTLSSLGVHPLSAITAVIAQGTRGVSAVWPLEPSRVRAQIEIALDDLQAHAAKTGALIDAGIVHEVANAFAARPSLPLVVDPVVASSSGARLLDDAGVVALLERLLPRATVVTPNAPELAVLLGDATPPRDEEALVAAALRLYARGARAVLAKGGHLDGDPVDVLVDGEGTHLFRGERVETPCTRGTGCLLSSAIAAGLARDVPLRDAVAAARALLVEAMRASKPLAARASPIDPFFERRR